MYAFRKDAPDHERYRDWLDGLVNSDESYAVSDAILSGFLRVVTHPRVFSPPTPITDALAFADAYRQHPTAVPVAPGERHWAIFSNLCADVGAKGNLIPDAFLAALAIESGSEFVTTDRDYARFPGLRWHHPLEGRKAGRKR